MRFIYMCLFVFLLGLGLAQDQEPKLLGLMVDPPFSESEPVARGQHILVRGIGQGNINLGAGATISLNMENESVPLRQVQLLPPDSLTQDTFVFMIPYHAANGTYNLSVQWTNSGGEQFNVSTGIEVRGTIDSRVAGWDCLFQNNETSITPTCAEPGELVSRGLDNKGWDTLKPFLSDNPEVTQESLCNDGQKTHLGSWLCASDEVVAFVAGQFANDDNNDPLAFNIPQGTPGGINEAFILTKKAKVRDYINVLANVGVEHELRQAVVTFERDITTIGGNLEGLRQAAGTTQFELLDPNYIRLGGTIGLCEGAISTWTVLDSSLGLGEALAILQSNLETYVRPFLDEEARRRGDDKTKFIVDPVPNPKGCQINTDYLDTIKVTPERIYDNGTLGNGNGATIAVLDTGVTNVVDAEGNALLGTQILKIAGLNQNVIDNTDDFSDRFVPLNPDIDDDGLKNSITGNTDINGDGLLDNPLNVGHGTGIALLAAGNTTEVAPQANIFPVRTCNEGGICLGTDIIKGMCKALNNNNPNMLVINMSFGGTTPMRAIEELIRDATDEAVGVVFVAAAGNQGEDNCSLGECATRCVNGQCSISEHFHGDTIITPIDEQTGLPNAYPNKTHFPASLSPSIDGLIAVGAVATVQGTNSTSEIKPRWYSNRGDYVDLAAPDDLLLKGIPPFIATHPYNNSSSISFYKGTSFSTGLVSGAAAVLKQVSNDNGSPATPAQIDSCLKSRVQVLNSLNSITNPSSVGLTPSEQSAVGTGMLDVGKAIKCILSNP